MFTKNKRYLFIAASLLASGLVTSQTSAAEDGTITFNGEITSVTCDITGGMEGQTGQGADFTVTLPTVSTTALDASGRRAGDTGFWIGLSGANCRTGQAGVYFERAQSKIDTTTGRLTNTSTASGAARNVQIGLLTENKTDINLNNAGEGSQQKALTASGVRFNYWAQYYATAVTTAGPVSADLLYSIRYN